MTRATRPVVFLRLNGWRVAKENCDLGNPATLPRVINIADIGDREDRPLDLINEGNFQRSARKGLLWLAANVPCFGELWFR
jgi:hypothetical protein